MTTNPNYPFNFSSLSFNMLENPLDDEIQNKSHRYYNLSKEEINILLLNPLFNPHRDEDTLRTTYTGWGQVVATNSKGFRSNEFKNNEEIVIAGCSHTFGYGVPEETIWGVKVAKHFNFSYANLGIPGASVSTIVNNLFAYFKEYGHPKTIICMFPNFQRILLPVDINVLKAENTLLHFANHNKKMSQVNLNKRILGESYLDFNKTPPKYSKLPHLINDIMPEVIPYWLATQSIHFLEQYCETAGIKLYWSIWDWITVNTFKIIKEENPKYFKSMIDVKMDHWIASVQKNVKDAKPISYEEIRKDRYHFSSIEKDDVCIQDKDLDCSKVVECHKELEAQDPSIFNIASDFAHWGTHRHAHIAEIFIEELSK